MLAFTFLITVNCSLFWGMSQKHRLHKLFRGQLMQLICSLTYKKHTPREYSKVAFHNFITNMCLKNKSIMKSNIP